MCSTMSGEEEKKRKRKKERPADENSAEQPTVALSTDVKPSKKQKPKSKAKRLQQEEAAVSQIPQKDHIKGVGKKKKKRRKTEAASLSAEHAVLADKPELISGRLAASADLQGHETRPINNKEEAEEFRARLGISAADPNSAKTRKSFQFSFSLPEPTEPAQADKAVSDRCDHAAVGDDGMQPPAAEPEQACSDADPTGGQEAVPASFVQLEEALPGPPARNMEEFVPRRVYVGGMPFWYTEDQIRECWGECGEIESLTMLTFPDSGNFRGLVFITFTTQEAFEAALSFNGDELEGKYLVVKPCRAAGGTTTTHTSQQEKSSNRPLHSTALTADKHVGPAASKKGAGKSPGKGAQKVAKKFDKAPERVKDYNVLFVGNVPWELTRSSVAELFREFKPKFVRMFDKPGSRQHKGFAHIHFADEASVDKALSMNGASIMGRQIVVMYAQPTKKVEKKPTQDLIEDGM